jgi:hypothetical protein
MTRRIANTRFGCHANNLPRVDRKWGTCPAKKQGRVLRDGSERIDYVLLTVEIALNLAITRNRARHVTMTPTI